MKLLENRPKSVISDFVFAPALRLPDKNGQATITMSLQRDVDCPICLSQLLFSRAGCTLMTCCGNFMHEACSFGLDTSSTSNTIKDHCPLCRADRLVEHSTEMIERVRTHSQANKPWAFYQLGLLYRDGTGVTKSLSKSKKNLLFDIDLVTPLPSL